MIKNIIFDVYGTLVSTGKGSVTATGKIFGLYKSEDTPECIYRRWKEVHKCHMHDTEEFLPEREIFVKDLAQLFAEYRICGDPDREVQPMLDSLLHRKLYPEVEQVVGQLLRTYNVAIGSITDNAPLLENIQGTILAKIPRIFTSESLKTYKPKETFYLEILKQTGWKAEECMFVGDSIEEDVIGPKKIGMKAAFVNRKGITDPMWLSHADVVIQSLEELIVYLADNK